VKFKVGDYCVDYYADNIRVFRIDKISAHYYCTIIYTNEWVTKQNFSFSRDSARYKQSINLGSNDKLVKLLYG